MTDPGTGKIVTGGPRGKLRVHCHGNAYVSLQTGRAGRKAHYGCPAKATGRLARRAQQGGADGHLRGSRQSEAGRSEHQGRGAAETRHWTAVDCSPVVDGYLVPGSARSPVAPG